MTALLGMSEKRRNFPFLSQTGPSVQAKPSASFSRDASLPTRSSKAGSSRSMEPMVVDFLSSSASKGRQSRTEARASQQSRSMMRNLPCGAPAIRGSGEEEHMRGGGRLKGDSLAIGLNGAVPVDHRLE